MQELPTFAPRRTFNPLAAMPPELRPVVKKRKAWRRKKASAGKQKPKPRPVKSRRSS